jgi:outer membrane lipoprotein-sorting protein
MKRTDRVRKILVSAALLCSTVFTGWAETSAQEMIRRVDRTLNAPKDQKMTATLVLIDKNGKRQERVIEMLQKGSDRRLARFLAPADQEGIAVLTLPKGMIYVYLPAYKTVKRIASHVKNNRFAGTDFTYEDMEARDYSESYRSELLREEEDAYVLELVPSERGSDYSRLVMWVRRDIFLPAATEFYDRKGNLVKKMTSGRVEKVDGYWISRETEMVDFNRDHRTRMILDDIELDTGLSDDVFTTRYLQR